jgi:hypothetical protein
MVTVKKNKNDFTIILQSCFLLIVYLMNYSSMSADIFRTESLGKSKHFHNSPVLFSAGNEHRATTFITAS